MIQWNWKYPTKPLAFGWSGRPNQIPNQIFNLFFFYQKTKRKAKTSPSLLTPESLWPWILCVNLSLLCSIGTFIRLIWLERAVMKRYRNGEIWDFEHETPVSEDRPVILGLDGGTTSTVCICMPVLPFSNPLPDPLPVLARAVAGCSNHNSVGGQYVSSVTFLYSVSNFNCSGILFKGFIYFLFWLPLLLF